MMNLFWPMKKEDIAVAIFVISSSVLITNAGSLFAQE